MRHFVLALLLVAGAEAAALACSCIRPPTEQAERERLARDVAEGAIALVEAELVRPYDAGSARGERLRVRRILAGQAPRQIEIERDGPPSSVSCDVEFRRRDRVLVLLYPPRQAGSGRYRLADSCLTYLLADLPFRAALVAALAPRP